jgi:hypothetical protein
MTRPPLGFNLSSQPQIANASLREAAMTEHSTPYPVRVDAALDPSLSRGLWLIKWLLLIPHYIVLFFLWVSFCAVGFIAFFAILFTGRYPRPLFDFNLGVLRWENAWTAGGLVGLLVLIAAIVLLFTGRYPKALYDLVLGLDRWVLRVTAYTALMTDHYPPFRLDQGGTDPGSHLREPAAPAPSGEAAAIPPATPVPAR